MNKLINILFSIIIVISFNKYVNSQITRGASDGEIYLASGWYVFEDTIYSALLHSWDNGASIELKYYSTNPPKPGSMRLSVPIGDATPGVVYNYGFYKLWISYDYGVNWDILDSSTASDYVAGSQQGEIYKYCGDEEGTLHRSDNYGAAFQYLRDSIKFPLEVVTEPGELYGLTGFYTDTMYLEYSNDYGMTFNKIPIDSVIIPIHSLQGYFPEIHRGTEQGEIYLTSWHLPVHYRIYHSTDFGHTFELKYISDSINLYSWGVGFAAGREQGSFYVGRNIIDTTYTHMWLYIDYSNDFGESFTTYFHDLNPSIWINECNEPMNISWSIFPNPCLDKFTIRINQLQYDNFRISIHNSIGETLKTIDKSGTFSSENYLYCDVYDLVPGLYYVSLTNGKHLLGCRKIIILGR